MLISYIKRNINFIVGIGINYIPWVMPIPRSFVVSSFVVCLNPSSKVDGLRPHYFKHFIASFTYTAKLLSYQDIAQITDFVFVLGNYP